MGSSVLGCWTGSLDGGAPTPKSRDLAEDERLQQVNWSLIRFSQLQVEMRRCIGDLSLADR